MEEINRRTENAHLIMGASIDAESRNRLGLTLVASKRKDLHDSAAISPSRSGNGLGAALLSASAPSAVEPRTVQPRESEPDTSRTAPSPSHSTGEGSDLILRLPGNGSNRIATQSSRRLQQASLPLEIVSKGRFAQSHRTIHRGEDLDVPTYVRRGIPLN